MTAPSTVAPVSSYTVPDTMVSLPVAGGAEVVGAGVAVPEAVPFAVVEGVAVGVVAGVEVGVVAGVEVGVVAGAAVGVVAGAEGDGDAVVAVGDGQPVSIARDRDPATLATIDLRENAIAVHSSFLVCGTTASQQDQRCGLVLECGEMWSRLPCYNWAIMLDRLLPTCQRRLVTRLG